VIGPLGFAPFGAGVGLGIGAVISRMRTIYRAPENRASVPASRDGVGVRVSPHGVIKSAKVRHPGGAVPKSPVGGICGGRTAGRYIACYSFTTLQAIPEGDVHDIRHRRNTRDSKQRECP
jgi:hypothetical protein